ncbi:uncharacterized protein DS421_12g374580 [Arachis hypogaea]|nr:uncharacterized protein DS421_12g374580 [Arachis hypogaea]QHO24709.1 uncharacterized protein DS421_12g374580 [Arachis hypogaea]
MHTSLVSHIIYTFHFLLFHLTSYFLFLLIRPNFKFGVVIVLCIRCVLYIKNSRCLCLKREKKGTGHSVI